MKFVLRLILVCVVTEPIFASDVFDLKGAVSHALQQVPALASVHKEKQISELNARTAQFWFFPKFNLSASTSLSTAPPLWPTPWNNALSITLNQPLLSNSANGIGFSIAQTQLAIAQIDVQLERDRLCMKVVKDFYAYSLAVEQLNLGKQKLHALLRQLDLVTRRFQQGFKTQKDVLRFEAQVQQTQIQQATANNLVAQSKETLITSITGTNRQQLTTTMEFVAEKPLLNTLDAIPVSAPPIEHHALYKRLDLEQKIESFNVDLSRRQLWPELSAFTSVSGSANFSLNRGSLFEPSSLFMVGLTLNYELFDFGKRRRDIAIAQKRNDIKANAIQTQLALETANITQMMVSFGLLQESIALNKKLLALEEDNFKRIQTDYQQGKAQYLDVIAALNSVADVKSALYSAIFDLKTHLVTYRYYQGTLYDWIF